jgi:hypothetical protein
MQKRFAFYEAFSSEYVAILYAAELEDNGYETRVEEDPKNSRWFVEAWEYNDADKD